MRNFAMVKKIEGQLVQVVPLISDACISCVSTDCAKQGHTFSVINKRNIEIKENSIVRIGVSKLSQCLQGLLALAFPILSAISGFILAPAAAERFTLTLSEGFQALCVLSFFLVSCLIVFIVSRSSIHVTLPEIIQVL